jgi:hypothetical protein
MKELLDLIEQLRPCAVISSEDNIAKVNEWINDDSLEFISTLSKEICSHNVYIIPVKDGKPIKMWFG